MITPSEFHDAFATLRDDFNRQTTWSSDNPDMSALYARGYAICQQAGDDPLALRAIFDDPRVKSLRAQFMPIWLKARAAEQESMAHSIINAPSLEAAKAFVYTSGAVKGHLQLAGMAFGRVEWNLLSLFLGRPPRRLAMLGSGALNESALVYHDLASAHGEDLDILNIDYIEEYNVVAQDVCEKLGQQRGMTFLTADALQPIGQLSDYDVISIGAHIGFSEEQKCQCLRAASSSMKSGTLLSIRAAKGAYSMLWMDLDTNLVKTQVPDLKPLIQVSSLDGSSNSWIYIFQKV